MQTPKQDLRGILVLGSTGQIGRALKTGASEILGSGTIWQARRPLPGHLEWDILRHPPPRLQCRAILSLAGSNVDNSQTHCALAKAACDLGEKLNVPVLLASSQAVYGLHDRPMSESMTCNPTSAYGQAKLEMEESVRGRPKVTCLRIGNVPGADMLFREARKGRVVLHQWPDGTGPVRSMIGLRTLADVLTRLLTKRDLPPILNVAQPGLVAMEDLLSVADIPWSWEPAPAHAVQRVELDLTLLTSIVTMPAGDAATMVSEARRCGAIS